MRRTFLPLALAACLAATAATAQVSQSYKDWSGGPAGFLLTENERKAYAQVKTDTEAQAFIDLFWARRDPDLNTVQNEFKLDYDMRVAAADKQFSSDKIKGSMSDRAKVLILMGRPLAVHNLPPGAEEEQEGTRPGFLERGATQVWIYTKDGKPAAKKSDEILFVFSETRIGAGDFLLDRADRRNLQALKLLAARPEQLLLHPKLTEVPRIGLLSGSKAATSSQQAVFDLQPRPWPDGAAVLAVSGVQSEAIHPIWVYLQFPDAVPPLTQAVGRVRKAEGGEVVGSFAAPVLPLSVPGARAYEFSLPVEAGTWKVDLALLNDSAPVAVTTVDAKNEPVPAEGPYISPMYCGAEIRQAAQARLGDSFHLGGMQLIPRLDNRYKSDENITYAAYVIRPSLDEQGQPKIELAIGLYSAGKKHDEQPFQPVTGVRVVGDIWVFGQLLPLSGFRRGVEFELEVSLRDPKSAVTRTTRIPFTVVKEEPAASAVTPTAVPKG
jgi:GWxTD domain-containing protein